MRTGDLGRIDADGRLHVVGRATELIIRGGFNVYPPEVEAALNDHPAVIQSAVIGRKLPGGNEEVLPFVQTAEPERLHAADLAAHVAERLSAYKRPSRIVIAANLPAAATGKILKHRLLAHFAAELESDTCPPALPGRHPALRHCNLRSGNLLEERPMILLAARPGARAMPISPVGRGLRPVMGGRKQKRTVLNDG